MRKLYLPSPEPETTPIWTVDRVGDLFATVVLFALIFVVGVASCWEAIGP